MADIGETVKFTVEFVASVDAGELPTDQGMKQLLSVELNNAVRNRGNGFWFSDFRIIERTGEL